VSARLEHHIGNRIVSPGFILIRRGNDSPLFHVQIVAYTFAEF
jgi:hypothetical protein